VQKKAVPTMIRIYHNTDHEGTAHESRKEAPGKEAANNETFSSPRRPIAAAVDTGVSHPRGLQASPKCRLSQKTAALGSASAAVCAAVDDVVLLTTRCSGDSLPEKFEAARGFYVLCCPKRRRPGKSFSGFEKACSKLPIPVLRALAAALRTRIETLFGERLIYKDFVPLGCDGTRQSCPRSEELERRLGTFGKKDSSPASPMLWNTSIVHLALGIPWCWRFGRGTKASERTHLRQMIPLLPRLALIVTDAGYVGYELIQALVEANVWFLIRMSSNATFYSEEETPLARWREGIVYYWPKERRAAGEPAPC